MRPNLSRTAKRTLIAGATLIAGGSLPVVPNELQMDYAYQYPVEEVRLMEEAVNGRLPLRETRLPIVDRQTSTPKTANENLFIDNDGNGIISVAAFRDSDGNKIEVQIPDTRYAAMGQKGGVRENPKDTEYKSTFETLFSLNRAEAAIAFDSATEDKTAAATSLTYAHTTSGTDRFLYVALTTLSNNHTGTAATYNGTGMTVVEQNVVVFSSTWQHHGFQLANPDSGTNNVVVSANVVSFSLRSGAVSYTGVDQTNPIQTSNTGSSGSGGTMNISLTTSNDGWFVISGANVDTAWSAGATTDTLRASYSGLADIADSGNDITAGTTNAQMAHVGTRGYGGIAFALEEAGGGGPAPSRRIMIIQ